MSKSFEPALFSVPSAPARTTVPEPQAAAFTSGERRDEAPVPIPTARLSVDIPHTALRAIKIHAVQRGLTVREVVLRMLAREGF